jgi:hypothetical protein
MEGRDQTIQYLTQLKREMSLRKERLLRPVQELEKQLANITETITLVLQGEPEKGTDNTDEFPLRKLRKLTHTQALVEIARHNGGLLKAQEAKVLMIRAGVMRDTKNSTHMVHGAIARSEAFERVGRGEYRLKQASSTANKAELFSAPVQ